MPEHEVSSEPIRIAGHDIDVTLSAAHFWGWHSMAEIARDCLRKDPAKATEVLSELMDMLGRRYAVARKDDPGLPGHWRRYLDK